MKKILLSILTVFYMTVSSGIAMEIHYCMGKKAGVDFYKTGNEKCGKCGMKEKKSGCCHDEHKFHKLQDSHKNVYNNISFEAGEIAIIPTVPVYNWQLISDPENIVSHSNDPPIYDRPSACILYCIFRI